MSRITPIRIHTPSWLVALGIILLALAALAPRPIAQAAPAAPNITNTPTVTTTASYTITPTPTITGTPTPMRTITPIPTITATPTPLTTAAPPQSGLDFGFGYRGVVTAAFTGFSTGLADVAVQPNGKILVLGTHEDSLILRRYFEDGTLEASFGGTGVVTTTFSEAVTAQQMLIQPDRSIVVLATGGDHPLVLARYLPTGALDPGFGTGGQMLSDMRGRFRLLGFNADGTIVLARYTNYALPYGAAIVHYRANGTLDTGFGTNGSVWLGDLDFSSTLMQPDGKILFGVFGGYSGCDEYCWSTSQTIYRFLPNGQADPGFNTIHRLGPQGNLGPPISLALQPDGRVVAVSHWQVCLLYCQDRSEDWEVARYTEAGTLDSTFGNGGTVLTDFYGDLDSPIDSVVQPDGRIVVVGYATARDVHHFALARYLTNGTPDSSFGNGGKVVTLIETNSDARRVLLDGSGRLVVGGAAWDQAAYQVAMAVARYCTICAPVTYSDVPADSTFYPYITCLSGKSVISGYADCTYRPGNIITRGDMAEAISKAAGYTDAIPPSRQSFSDVSNGYNYWLYVERLVAHGVVGGYSDGTYRADNGVTRGQMAKFISIAAGYNDAIPAGRQTFRDVPPRDTYWVYIERLVVHGVVGGYSDHTYREGNAVTRGQIAKFIGNTFFPGCTSALAPGK